MRRTLLIAYAGVFTALTTVATILIQIPVPQTKGYINLGDTMVILSGLLLGSLAGFIAGGVGSALADIVSGYGHWAPFTLVIKGLEGLIVGIFAKKGRVVTLLGTIIGGTVMVIGYFIVEYFLYGLGGALAELPGNIFQAVSGIVLANITYSILGRRIQKILAHPSNPY